MSHLLRGYATQFLQIERAASGLEFFATDAFNDFIAAGRGAPFLNFDDHDAEPLSYELSLSADDYGLRFVAVLSDEAWRKIRPWVTSSHTFASVYTTGEKSEMRRTADGRPCRRIVEAGVAHVTICDDPVYQGTGVWPAKVVGAMPPRLARLAARFDDGREAAQAKTAALRAVFAARARRQSKRPASAHRPPLDAATIDRYAAMRMEFTNAFTSGRMPTGLIIGHACFSRANRGK